MSDAQGAPGAEWVAISPDSLTWVEGPYGETAIVWGDPQSGPYAAFNRFPAGTVIPPHTHSADNQLVVVDGTLHNYRLDDDADVRAASYPAGSFIHETADVAHVLAVDPSGPATVYITQDAPLDLNLVEQDDPGWQS
jgi:hypothetical protein